MHAIYKYELGVLEKQTINLPRDAKILRVDSLDGRFWLWAMVDTSPDCQVETRYIEMYKTGMPIDNQNGLVYLGLCTLYVMQELGLYTFERV